MPPELSDRVDALYIYNARQCGLSLSDLRLLTYDQAMAVIELNEFVNDSLAHREDDEKARAGAAAFFA